MEVKTTKLRGISGPPPKNPRHGTGQIWYLYPFLGREQTGVEIETVSTSFNPGIGA